IMYHEDHPDIPQYIPSEKEVPEPVPQAPQTLPEAQPYGDDFAPQSETEKPRELQAEPEIDLAERAADTEIGRATEEEEAALTKSLESFLQKMKDALSKSLEQDLQVSDEKLAGLNALIHLVKLRPKKNRNIIMLCSSKRRI